jgi:uncharacterized protein
MPRSSDIESQDTAALQAYRTLIEALLDPACYPHRVRSVEHIETHISDVFLTGEYAYKLKKPLNLGFLDFSTLERRRQCCEEELRLNRRLAPELYRAVVEITGEPVHPRVRGEGAAIEVAVEMLQFDQAGVLDRVEARKELSGAHIDDIARTVAEFHAGLQPAAADSAYGTPESIFGPALQNFDQLLPLLEGADERAGLERLRDWTRARHHELGATFAQRHREGFVRECHGDLHLGNLVLIGDRVRVFDCIEFNPMLRWIDIVNEAAFLVMDLTQRGRSDLAFRFLNGYLERTGDYAGVRLLAYYMVYRALVRAKVAAMRATQAGVSLVQREALQRKCSAHVALAERLARDSRPALLILHGLSGSGKTTVAQTILEDIRAIRIRSDIERKRMHGMTAASRSGSGVAQGIYTEQAGLATYERLSELAAAVIQAGFPVLVDAAFLQRSQRAAFRSLARHEKVPFAIVHVDAREETLRRRIAQRAAATGAAADASEATRAVLDRQLATQDPLTEEERGEALVIDSERCDAGAIRSQARLLLQRLGYA